MNIINNMIAVVSLQVAIVTSQDYDGKLIWRRSYRIVNGRRILNTVCLLEEEL